MPVVTGGLKNAGLRGHFIYLRSDQNPRVWAIKFSYPLTFEFWVTRLFFLCSPPFFFIVSHRVTWHSYSLILSAHLHIPVVTHIQGRSFLCCLSHCLTLNLLLFVTATHSISRCLFLSTVLPPLAILYWSSKHNGLENVSVCWEGLPRGT